MAVTGNGISTNAVFNTAEETGFPNTAGIFTANCINIGALKIQYGIILTNINTQYTITFKEPFASTGYAAFASYTSDVAVNVANSNAAITNQHTDYCQIYTGGGRYAWLCIGY